MLQKHSEFFAQPLFDYDQESSKLETVTRNSFVMETQSDDNLKSSTPVIDIWGTVDACTGQSHTGDVVFRTTEFGLGCGLIINLVLLNHGIVVFKRNADLCYEHCFQIDLQLERDFSAENAS